MHIHWRPRGDTLAVLALQLLEFVNNTPHTRALQSAFGHGLGVVIIQQHSELRSYGMAAIRDESLITVLEYL